MAAAEASFSSPRVVLRRAAGFLIDRVFDARYRSAARRDALRVYHVHVPKTAGTSLNTAMLSLGGEAGAAVYRRLVASPGYRLISGGKVFAGWRKSIIETGDFNFAFSHIPLHQLRLPPGFFLVAAFRDPVDRVLSQYWELRKLAANNVRHRAMIRGRAWLGDSFTDYLERAPRDTLLPQISMFSRHMDVGEALENIAKLSHISFFDRHAEGIESLGRKLGLSLERNRDQVTDFRTEITPAEGARLREMLDIEYRLLREVRSLAAERHLD